MLNRILSILMIALSVQLNAQISITESFSSSTLPSGWSSNLTHSTSSSINCNTSGARYKNLYGTSYRDGYVITGDLGSQIASSTISVTYDFSVKEYSSYTATPAGEFTITAYYSSNGSTWVAIPSSVIDGTNYTPTTSCTTGSFSFASPGTSSLYIKINCYENTGDFYFSVNELSISESNPPCSGTPVPGNTLSAISGTSFSGNTICSGETVDFTVDGALASDVLYQWETSSDNSTWSSISGATSSTYSAAITTSSYYRCGVTCAAANATAFSASKQIVVGINAPDQPSNLTVGTVTSTTIPLSWTAPNSAPDSYIVVKHTSALSATPVDGTSYASGSSIGGGTVVYNGSSASCSSTALTPNTQYQFTVFPFNTTSSGCNVYNTTNAINSSQYTLPGVISSPSFGSITSSGFDLSWTAPTDGATSYVVSLYTNSSYSTAVAGADGLTTSNTSYTFTGLNDATTYYAKIWAVGSGGTGSGYQVGSVTTLCVTATAPTTTEAFNVTSGSLPACWEHFSGTLGASSTLTSSTVTSSYGWYPTSSTFGNFSGGSTKVTLYSTGTTYWLVSPSIDLGSTAGIYRLQYKLWAGSSSSTVTTDLLSHKIHVVVSTDNGATWSNTNIVQTHTGTGTYDGSDQSIVLTGYSGTVRIAFVAEKVSSTYRYVGIDDFRVTAANCSGSPNAGSITSAGGSAGSTVVLSLNGADDGAGITYQWESSTDGTNYSAIAGATSSTLSTTVVAGTYYRCTLTCTNSSQSTTTSGYQIPIQIIMGTSGSTTVNCGTDVILYDNGGFSSSYSNNASHYVVLNNGGTSTITISGDYDTESSWDYIYLYQGIYNAGGTLINSYSGAGTINYTSGPGEIVTVRFTSDGSTVKPGFALTATYSGNCINIWDGTSWSGGTPFTGENLEIQGNLQLAANLTAGQLSIASGWAVNIDPGYYLETEDDLTIGSTSSITLNADNTGYAQLKIGGVLTNNGSVIQEQYVPTTGQSAIASSMASGFNTTSGDNSTLYGYDANGGAYLSTSSTNLSSPGQGYFAPFGNSGFSNSGSIFSVSGTPNTSLVHNLGYSSTVATGGQGAGWNLIGNPYTCGLDWSNITRSNVNNAFYIWNPATSSYNYYVSGVSAPTGSFAGSQIVSATIPPLQAFWVQATSSSASLTSSMSTNGSVSSMPTYYKNHPDNIIITASQELNSSMADVVFIKNVTGATLNYEGEDDAWKMGNYGGQPTLFTGSATEKIAINSIDLGSVSSIPLYFDAPDYNVQFRIHLDQVVNSLEYDVHLEDHVLNHVVKLNDADYVFNFDSVANVNQRFTLHIVQQSIGTESESNEIVPNIYYANGAIVIISDPESYKEYQVSTIDGRVLAGGRLSNEGFTQIPLSKNGLVLVTVIGNGASTQKIFINN